MITSLKLGLTCVSSCSMARTTEYEYKKNRDWNPGIPGLEKDRDFNPGIQNRSGLTPLVVSIQLSITSRVLIIALLILTTHNPNPNPNPNIADSKLSSSRS